MNVHLRITELSGELAPFHAVGARRCFNRPPRIPGWAVPQRRSGCRFLRIPDGAISLWASFGDIFVRVYRNMLRTNHTAGSNPVRPASKPLPVLTFPDRTEESRQMPRNVRALLRGANCATKERRHGSRFSAPFGRIFSGARWRSPDSLRKDYCTFARAAMSNANHVDAQ